MCSHRFSRVPSLRSIILFVSLLHVPSFYASAQWVELNPKLPRVNYRGIDFVGPDTGWAVGDMGALLRTTNGGSNWLQVETGLRSSLLGVESHDGKMVIACGDSGKIIRSTDSGNSWTTIPSGRGGYLWNVQMISSNYGWLVGSNGALMKTTDGGLVWINKPTSLGDISFWSVDFVDSTFGYITASEGKILRTTNGGDDWDVQQAGDFYGIFAIKALDKMRAVAGGFAGKMVYTTNAGVSWQDLPRLTSTINDIAFADSVKGFAIADAGLYQTTDGGQTWQRRPESVEGSGLTFASDHIGYLVGPHLLVSKTTNKGQSWQRLILNENLTHVSFANESVGWVLGDSLYKTMNGGLNWSRQGNFGSYFPRAIIFFDTLTGFVGADRERIYKTTDGGATWIRKPISGLDTTYFVTKFFFANKEIGWALALYRGILKTTDGGETWFRQLSEGDILEGIHFADSINGWAVTALKVYKTTDGGTNWLLQPNAPYGPLDVYVSKVQKIIWLVTSQYLYKKTLSDSSWQIVFSAPNSLLKQIVWLNANHGFVFGGTTYETRNSGVTWLPVDQLSGYGIQIASFPNQIYGYGVGATGLILRYRDTTVTDLRGEWFLQPSDFKLFQNYPNPFNPSTIIPYSLFKRTHISLGVYNLLGQEIAVLVDEEKPAGSYSLQFAGDNYQLPSGVYFYRLRAGESVSTRKMLMMK